MAPELNRISPDEEINKILAELGILDGSETPAETEKEPTPAAPVVKEKTAAPAPVESEKTPAPSVSESTRVINRPAAEKSAAKPPRPTDERRPQERPARPSGDRPQRPAAQGQTRPASQARPASSSAPAQKRPPQRRPDGTQMPAVKNPQQRPRPAQSRPQQPAQRTMAEPATTNISIHHPTSNLRDDLEKRAVSTGQTGQLTRQLRSGKKLEEITGPLQAQQKGPRAPSERVQKAAAFAASVAAEPEEKNSIGKTIAGWVTSLLIVAVIIFVLFKFIIQIVTIEGSSMAPTLEAGDRVVISDLLYTPQQGDIVVLSDNNVLEKQLIKRIIAVEGEVVEITADGVVMVGGSIVDETYIDSETVLGDVTYPLTVQQGQVFVLGDNREQSLDSRDSMIGLVDTDEIVGRVVFRLYPFSAFGGVE